MPTENEYQGAKVSGVPPPTACSAVGIELVWIGVLPPEVGPEGTRLVVLLENKRWLSILLDHPIDNIELAKRLRQLADGITQHSGTGECAGSEREIVKRMTAAMRETDILFEHVGGSTRHYVRDCLLPMLKKHGLFISVGPSTQSSGDCPGKDL